MTIFSYSRVISSLSFSVHTSNIDQQITNTSGITPFVIIPSNKFDKVVIERDTSGRVKDCRVRIAEYIGGDDRVLGVFDNALVFSCSSFLDSCLDSSVRSGLISSYDEIYYGYIERGNSEGKTGELSVQSGDDFANSLGCTSRRRDNVVSNGTTTTPVLVRGTVDCFLCSGGSVYCRHQTFNDAKLVVDNLGDGSKAVGSAGCIRDNGVFGVVSIEVDTTDEHRCIGRRSSDNDLLRSALQVSGCLLGGCEDTGRFDDVICTNRTPWDVCRVPFSIDGDGFAIDDEFPVLGFDSAFKATVDGVVLEHVNHVFKIDKGIVNGYDIDVAKEQSITINDSTDTAETVDSYFDHCSREDVAVLKKKGKEKLMS